MAIRNILDTMPKKNSRILIYVGLACLLYVGVTAYWNWYGPYGEDYGPYIIQDLITLLPAIAAAVLGTILLHQFDRGDKPRRIWFWFVAGWWAWVGGEISFTIYDLLHMPGGQLSVYDIFWTAGYLCFGLSLFFQFRHIYMPQRRSGLVSYLLAVVLALLASLGLTLWAHSAGLGKDMSWFALYLAVFYPVCDIVEGVCALWLAFIFGRGNWGRPWWGLIAFAFADAINIFLFIGGYNILPEKWTNFLDPLSNTIYNGGYVVVMLGFLVILLLNFWSAPSSQTTIPGSGD
jgi:hypothetical protein